MIRMPVEPVVTDYLYRKATRMGIPFSGTFELTPLCNMSCKMCYVRLTPQKQAELAPLATAEQWLQLGKVAKDRGLLYLLLTGGEPFLHPQFPEIMRGLHEMGLLVSVNTNATLIDEQTVQWLKTCPPVRVNVTLYGASDETYAKLCGAPDGYSKVIHAVKLLKIAGIPVKINCSLTPDNIHDLPEIVAFCEENQLPLQTNAYMFPPTRRDADLAGRNYRFSPREAAYYTAWAELLTCGRERFLARQVAIPEPSEDCGQFGDGVLCRAGRCSFWVTWDGQLLPCGMFSLGDAQNVFYADFDSAWEQVKTQISQVRLPAKCAGCELKESCRACAAMVHTESGNFTEIPKYRCDMAHAFHAQRELLKSQLLAGENSILNTEGET